MGFFIQKRQKPPYKHLIHLFWMCAYTHFMMQVKLINGKRSLPLMVKKGKFLDTKLVFEQTTMLNSLIVL